MSLPNGSLDREKVIQLRLQARQWPDRHTKAVWGPNCPMAVFREFPLERRHRDARNTLWRNQPLIRGARHLGSMTLFVICDVLFSYFTVAYVAKASKEIAAPPRQQAASASCSPPEAA